MKSRGFSVVELILSLGVFGMLLVVLGAALVFTQSLVGRIQGQADSDVQLKKAAVTLQRDLAHASFVESSVAPGVTLSGARLGDCLWFLSPRDPSDEPHRKVNGTPFWSCNVLYYASLPTNHDTVFGQGCNLAADADGYDQNCPHKVLLRLEVDQGPTTNYSNESSEEELLPNPGGFLLQPTGFNAGSLAVGPIRSARIVAGNLLTFRVRNPGVEAPHSLEFDLRSVAIRAARRRVALGSTPLGESGFTTQWRWSLRPGMP